mmetsp:Transcript_19865/g.67698  ORF Transcript_19865/g.67698 Transcript_19865/m.67698 type:complete len:102 (+) Transcript_19865:185-490(+)
MNSHTIILMQMHPARQTRTYSEYETVSQAIDGICQQFEAHLKRSYPSTADLTYDINDLWKWVDSLTDLCALVYEPAIKAYVPFTKEWIKKRTYTHLRRQAL